MSKHTTTLRIGSGAETSDDRMVPALELAERGGGVTISLAQDIHDKSPCNVMPAIELPNYPDIKQGSARQ